MNSHFWKEEVCRKIDENREELFETVRALSRMPELGFKEYRTSRFVEEKLKGLGLSCETGLAKTGLRASVKGKESRRNIAIIGELDAVISPSHPEAAEETGAAHACGHHVQLANMLGAAYGLMESGVMKELCGDVTFLAVPAEEFVEIEYRRKLRENGEICYLSGKQELIRLGVFDHVDAAMMVHSHSATPERRLFLEGGSMGFTAKQIRFIGKEAHAGGAPHEGINALNAAMAAMMCIHANRETFRDEDGIRVHPILTKGGDLVNVVPTDVQMETYVRAKNTGALVQACEKVDRSIRGACYAIGAGCEIENMPGQLPLRQDPALSRLFFENSKAFFSEGEIRTGVDLVGSTDMGDLSQLIPCIHPTIGGFAGNAHSKDFCVADWETAVLLPAKMMAMTVIDLLADGAGKAEALCREFVPAMSKAGYCAFLDRQFTSSGAGGPAE